MAISLTGAAGAAPVAIPDDLHLLVGKRGVVGRMALCAPNTYTANLAYAGSAATFLGFTEPKAAGLMRSSMGRLPHNIRLQMEDAAKGGLLQVQFEDGTKLDTCGDLLWSQLATDLELAAGETIALPSAPRPLAAPPSAGSASVSLPATVPTRAVAASTTTSQQCAIVITNDLRIFIRSRPFGLADHQRAATPNG